MQNLHKINKIYSYTQQNSVLLRMLLPMANVAGALFFLVYVEFVLLLILYPVPILCGKTNILHGKFSLSEILNVTSDTSRCSSRDTYDQRYWSLFIV